MTNYSTPDESQDFLKSRISTDNLFQNVPKPSELTMNFIFGYSAALKILKTVNFGNVKILLN